MARKPRKDQVKRQIPKEWDARKGVSTLPDAIRDRVRQVIASIRLGEPPEENYFTKKLSPTTRAGIVYNLALGNVSYGDIAALLDISLVTVDDIMNRVKKQIADGLPLTWNRDSLIHELTLLERDAQWNRARAETAIDDEMSASFSRNAINATINAAKMRLQFGISKEWLEEMRRAGINAKGEAPDPQDRVNMFQWVYENKIVPKQIENKPTEAEIVDVEPDNATAGSNR